MSNANTEVKRHWVDLPDGYRTAAFEVVEASDYDQLAHQRDELRRELNASELQMNRALTIVESQRDEAVAALKDIKEWCENAKRTTGINPYGLAVVNAVLAKLGGGAA